jgi:biopolymer transport protein ExbD
VQSGGLNLGGPSFQPLIASRHKPPDSEFDVTAMVDLVFLMVIYFLVTFLTVAAAEINLPAASHVAPLDPETAVVLTVMGTVSGDTVTVYLADGKKGPPIDEAAEQEERIREAVEQGVSAGKTAVLIKAEKKVRLRELFRISTAAAVEGVKLHVAVMEMEGS